MIGKRIKLLRKENELTMKQLGEKIMLGESTISMYENEKRTPDFETIKKIAKVLNTTTSYLVGETNDPSPFNKERELYIPEELKNVGIAFHRGEEGLNQDEIDKITEFVKFIKSQQKDKK